MSSADLPSFRDAVEAHHATVHQTSAGECRDRIEAIIERPAVGTPIPIDGVTLKDGPVTLNPSPAALEAAETGITHAPLGIAEYGSVVVPSRSDLTEAVGLFPPTHVAVMAASDLVPDTTTALSRLDDAFEDGLTGAVIATGPSATADMGELVYGAHGPRTVHVVVITDR